MRFTCIFNELGRFWAKPFPAYAQLLVVHVLLLIHWIFLFVSTVVFKNSSLSPLIWSCRELYLGSRFFRSLLTSIYFLSLLRHRAFLSPWRPASYCAISIPFILAVTFRDNLRFDTASSRALSPKRYLSYALEGIRPEWLS